jgi:hypothetical protein
MLGAFSYGLGIRTLRYATSSTNGRSSDAQKGCGTGPSHTSDATPAASLIRGFTSHSEVPVMASQNLGE